MMRRTVWLDGDSVAREARRLAERHAGRRGYRLVVVADRPIPVSGENAVEFVLLEQGAEAVDSYLLSHAASDDLVVTRDLPLMEALLEREVYVMNDRGERFTRESIGKRRSERDMMEVLRRSGMVASAGPSYGKKEIKMFADAFDSFLAKWLK